MQPMQVPVPLPRSSDSISSDDESWCSEYVEPENEAGNRPSAGASSESGRGTAAAVAAWSVDSLPAFAVDDATSWQHKVVRSLSGLKKVAGQLCVIMMQADCISRTLRDLSFIAVKSSSQYSLDFWRTHEPPPRANAILLVQAGLEVDEQASRCTDALSRNAHLPAIIVVVIPAESDLDTGTDEESGSDSENDGRNGVSLSIMAYREKLRILQDKYIESGADDVLVLERGEQLKGHRVLEAIHRSKVQAKNILKLNEQVFSSQQQAATQVQTAKHTLCRKMQVAWKDLMWNLPSKLLEGIPPEDPTLEEYPARSETERGGVGDYKFTAMLSVDSNSSLAAVPFLAEHPQHGRVAVKVIQKRLVRSVAHLFVVDQEMRILKNLPPHPNVARAHTVLHSERNIFLVMDYCGAVSLHKFAQQSVAQSGEVALPQELAGSFCKQMAMAISHLHGLLICHRDIKPTNFIVSDDGETIRLGEFNLVMILCSRQQLLTQCCGSLPFCAPEVLKQERGGIGYNPFAADIWSLAGNFAELALGPYGMEKLLGWVPIADAYVERRHSDLERLPAILANSPDFGIPGINALISKMWVLDPPGRWSILDVIGPKGFNLDLPEQPQTRGGFKMHASENLSASANGVVTRPVELEFQGPKARDRLLLERFGGAPFLRRALDIAFDEALAGTPLGMILEGKPASIPAIRSLYLEKVVQYFSTDPGSPEAQIPLTAMKNAHRNWIFSDADFDTFMAHLGMALERLGVREDSVREAVACFGNLREAITDGFQVGAAHARQRNTAAWMAEVANAVGEDGRGRLKAVAVKLAASLKKDKYVDLLHGLPPEMRSPEGIEAELLKYFSNEASSPLPLQSCSLSLDQLALLVECMRRALMEARWPPEDTLTTYFALKEEWDRAHLNHELRKLSHLMSGVGQVAWMTFSLRLHQALQLCPTTAQISECNAFIWCLSQISFALQKGYCDDPRRFLSADGGILGLRHAHVDALIEVSGSACSHFPPGAASQVASALRTIRPWLVRSGG